MRTQGDIELRAGMKKRGIIVLCALALGVSLGLLVPNFMGAPAMDDAKAMTTAFHTFGPQAAIEKVRKFGDTNWTYRVGFYSPQCIYPITWAGQGSTTWNNAFDNIPAAAIPVEKKGTINLQVTSGSVADPLASVSIKAASFQFSIDTVDTGAPIAISDPTLPWTAIMNFDTTTISDGYHVVCGKLSDSEGSYGAVPATMLKIKQ